MHKSRKYKYLAALLALTSSLPASADLIVPDSASVVAGTLAGGSAGLIIDGSIPPEGQYWQTDTAYWWGTSVILQVDLGALYVLEDVLVSVDNNDAYLVEYSADGMSYNDLFDIAVTDGEIQVFPGGMDTMSSDSANAEYVPSVDFTPVDTRYLRISATGGDNAYSVGEIQAFGRRAGPATVPEPGAFLLLGGTLLLLPWMRRSRS